MTQTVEIDRQRLIQELFPLLQELKVDPLCRQCHGKYGYYGWTVTDVTEGGKTTREYRLLRCCGRPKHSQYDLLAGEMVKMEKVVSELHPFFSVLLKHTFWGGLRYGVKRVLRRKV